VYCAEHIHLDPHCLYAKCKSTYQKTPGDRKGCREVVLKEFTLCHKHYNDAVKRMKGESGAHLVVEKLNRVSELLTNLEDEAIKAKKTDADLFQRKNKLIPKFHEMRAILRRKLCELRSEGFVGAEVPEELFSDGDGDIIPTPITPNSVAATPNPANFPPTNSPSTNSVNFTPSPINSPSDPTSQAKPPKTPNSDFSTNNFGLPGIIPEILSE